MLYVVVIFCYYLNVLLLGNLRLLPSVEVVAISLGPLSRIKPLFSVTRNYHGNPLYYHRQLIDKKFEWSDNCSLCYLVNCVSTKFILSLFTPVNTRIPIAQSPLFACIIYSFPTVIHIKIRNCFKFPRSNKL
jgi:hypothetical protein